MIKENDVCIIIGETGSGKSTQIPQICLDAGLHRCSKTGKEQKIVVTQPRRIAASALAKRVAAERNSKVGNEIGFKYRFENTTSADTRIVYATDGILLNDAMHDPFLPDYSLVIIDEAHERAVHTDMLLMFLHIIKKKNETLARASKLRIVIMSATVEAEKFSRYFNDAKIFAIEGRTYETKARLGNYYFIFILLLFSYTTCRSLIFRKVIWFQCPLIVYCNLMKLNPLSKFYLS